MSDLIDFLRARIAEDEAVAHEPVMFDSDGWARLADRVLAECEAKRRIVEMYVGPTEDHEGNPLAIGGYGEAWLDATLILAMPYADHPDYRPEWRP